MTIPEEKCKEVYTLNTWYESNLTEASEWLEAGYWVHFGSSCIGHTLAHIVENEGIRKMREKYGDRLEVEQRDGWGWYYCHLK